MTNLKKYYPMLRTKEQVRESISKNYDVNRIFLNMSPVYSIIFMETSSGEFRRYPSDYIFRSAQKTDPDINLEFLQYFIFIPLDNFLNSVKNKKQEGLSDLDAWLLFLSSDNPEDILYLTERHPEFIPMYEQLFTICSNEGRMLEMYSAELRMMDNNTVKLMIDKMNEKLDEKDREIEAKDREIEANKHELEAKDREIEKLKAMLAEK